MSTHMLETPKNGFNERQKREETEMGVGKRKVITSGRHRREMSLTKT